MRQLPPALTALLALALLVGSGCGSNETQPNEPDPDPVDSGDGRYHPPPNNQHITEDAACALLEDAQSTQVQALKCPITTRTCPSLLRFEFITQCMEYDQGSVQGCVDYYKMMTTCDDLAQSFKDCVVTPYPGTEPAGCAMP